MQWNEGEWYYVLEDYNAPKNAWDWREYAACYGPYPSKEDAYERLHNNHANPGGATIDTDPDKSDAMLIKLVASAKKETR
jgi:hypothetical protein